MSNQFFDFDLAFKKILFVIETLKKEGVEIFPALRINDYYKPGYHGREQRAYSEHFFCLALLRENDAVICYLESANFGPKSDLLFMKIQTEKVSLKHILRLTTNEFKNKLGSHLFLPSDPNDNYMRTEMIEVRNLLFQAINTLYNDVNTNKLAKIYDQGGTE